MLIPTKLSIPPLRRNAVERPRLLRMLSSGQNRPLISISGPAGSGKTSLVCQWLRAQRLPVTWYSINKSDNTLDVFYQYLLTAIIQKYPQFEIALSPYLQNNARSCDHRITTAIIEAVSHLDCECYLVLEDYHLISTSKIHTDLEFLITHAPQNLHLVFLSRHALPFPLATWQAKDQITEIKTEDLQFNLDEVMAFYRQVMKLPIQRALASSLLKLTEGWAAGLQLAGLALQKIDPKDQLDSIAAIGSTSNVINYFFEEVLKEQPQKVEDFLFATAILDRFNGSLVREMTQSDDAQELLLRLEKDNFFILPLDSGHHWFRYHHIFGDALQKRLCVKKPEYFLQLHKKAAVWYAHHQFLEEAFNHAFSSNDNQFAANLLTDQLLNCQNSLGPLIAQRWLERLPNAIYQHHGILRLYHVLILLLQWDVPAAIKFLTLIKKDNAELMAGLSEDAKQYFLQLQHIAQSVIGLIQDPIAVDFKVLMTTPIKDPSLQKTLQALLGWHYIEKGELDKAAETLPRIRPHDHNIQSNDQGVILRQQTHIELQRGHLKSAENTLRQLFKIIKRSDLPIAQVKSFYNLMLCRINYFRGLNSQGLSHGQDAIDFFEETFMRDFLCDSYLYQGFILQAQGEKSAATGLMEKALFIAHKIDSPYFTAYVKCQVAQLALFQNNIVDAVSWAEHRNLKMDGVFSEKHENECLVLAQLKLAQQQPQEALRILKRLREQSFKRQRLLAVLQIDILRAVALYSIQGLQAALPVFEKALGFAASEDFVQPFINFSEHISELLQAIERSPESHISAFAMKLSDACREKNTASNPLPMEAIEQLTPREMELLKMIAQGDSNQAMADKLTLSINTVKYYLKNLYGKLGAKSRVQAVMNARLLKLL